MIEYLATSSGSPAAGTSVVNVLTWSLSPGATVYFAVHNLGTASTGVSGLGATWSRIANVTGVGVGVEIWMGVGPTATGNVTTTFAGSTKASYTWLVIEQTGTKTAGTAATATGSSVTADPGTVTPAAGDVVIVAQTHANVTTPSANTDTPVSPNSFATLLGTAATGTSGTMAWRQANATTATKRTFTITSAQWAAAGVAITAAVSSAAGDVIDEDTALANDDPGADGRAYRGQDTDVLDDAGSY